MYHPNKNTGPRSGVLTLCFERIEQLITLQCTLFPTTTNEKGPIQTNYIYFQKVLQPDL